MGKVSCFNIDGIYCWFNSQEHRPAHFHAKKRGHWHLRVYFQETKDEMIERAKGPRERVSSADAKVLTDMAQRYRAELLEEWGKKVRCDA
jgi:D-hexose-6-phosphate mutarotase